MHLGFERLRRLSAVCAAPRRPSRSTRKHPGLRVWGRETSARRLGGSCPHSQPHARGYIRNITQRNKTKCEVVNESAAKAVPGLSCKLPRCSAALTLTSAPSAFLSFPQPVTRAECLLTLKQLPRQTHTFPRLRNLLPEL